MTGTKKKVNQPQLTTHTPMEEHKIVPDVIDIAPTETIRITYFNNIKAEMGNTLTPTQAILPPIVTWNADPQSLYLLCMTDPDVPSRSKPKLREWRHWLIGNIPGDDIDQGELLTGYVGCGPKENTGPHRYVFLVYKQPHKIDFKEPRIVDSCAETRGKFSIKKLAHKYDLGQPVAGNFFLAEWDESVPLLYRKFSG